MAKFLIFLSMIILTGCASEQAAITPTTTPSSAWGKIYTIGQAEQANAPALLAQGDRLLMVWTTLEDGVQLRARTFANGALSPVTTLAAPSPRPFNLTLHRGGTGYAHLLWLDWYRDVDMRVFSASLSAEPAVVRGGPDLSDRRTDSYAAVALPDGTLWTVWSGGNIAEPSLYSQRIDPVGRPQEAQFLVTGAAWPALLRRDNGTLWLLWTDISDNHIWLAELTDGTLVNPRHLTSAPELNPGDRLRAFHAGQDDEYVYLFWNITRADGDHQTFYTAGRPDISEWALPSRLGVAWINAGNTVKTGWQSDDVAQATDGARWLSWAHPLRGQHETLPVAVNQGDEIGVLYLRSGMILGYQSITESGPLIGRPSLAVSPEGYLYLAWSQPGDDARSALLLTTTQPRP